MEIDVSQIIEAHLSGEMPAYLLSGSVCELGRDAARITWKNAQDFAELFKLTDEEVVAVREDLREEGMDDIGNLSRSDVVACVVQCVAHEIRQIEGFGLDLENFTDEEFSEATENCGGRSQSDLAEFEGKWYFYFGM